MNFVVAKDSFIAIENGKDITQVSYDKSFYVATRFSTGDSSRKHLCRDITFRVHNKEQHNFVLTKIIYVTTNKT